MDTITIKTIFNKNNLINYLKKNKVYKKYSEGTYIYETNNNFILVSRTFKSFNIYYNWPLYRLNMNGYIDEDIEELYISLLDY